MTRVRAWDIGGVEKWLTHNRKLVNLWPDSIFSRRFTRTNFQYSACQMVSVVGARRTTKKEGKRKGNPPISQSQFSHPLTSHSAPPHYLQGIALSRIMLHQLKFLVSNVAGYRVSRPGAKCLKEGGGEGTVLRGKCYQSANQEMDGMKSGGGGTH